MNIEEDIKNLKTYIELVIEKNYCDCNELNTICYGKYGDGSKNVAKSIENVLTAYEKEKGENVKLRLQDIPLIEGELKAYKDRVNELKQELEKEKEKNKELEEYRQVIIDKDKLIEELKKYKK